MNKNAIKSYAIWARNELIDKVSQKAYEYGIEKESNSISFNADTINGRILSSDEKSKRQSLLNEINHKGYDQVMEEVAYTWFNRFIALRFMEVNNYLPNRVRLFTNENNEFKPQILDEALHIELSGLDKNKVIQLKEANNEEELYKELLLATCNDMSKYLPGMFKPISDYMTLLFPSNLLREESVLGRLISDIDEDSWTDQVQIIGWLYQYYNTEPKEKTFADLKKNVKINKNTIAPATQLFTPDWIVRYMTENSLGKLWLDGHPNTDIKSNWTYYLDEAEQEESVQIELNKIKAEHAKLTPQDIKLLDPCMGSGHILVYAFDVFMQIYVSEGWTEREAARAILENNIYGLDIDERAYQLSYFALMMKARQYNRRILSERIIPNVMAIEESNNFNKDLLHLFGDLKPLAERVVDIFNDAKEYGSILNVEFTKEELDSLDNKLIEIKKMVDYGNLLEQSESIALVETFSPFLKQARIMSQKYECVVTNPPYMSSGGMNNKLNNFIKKNYADEKADLFAACIDKCLCFTKKIGFVSMITMESWMFLPVFEKSRKKWLKDNTISSLIHMPYLGKGGTSLGIAFGNVAFTIETYKQDNYLGHYQCIRYYETDENGIPFKYPTINERFGYRKQSDFTSIRSFPIAYWASNNIFDIFKENKTLETYVDARSGISTGDNNRFYRCWFECAKKDISFDFRFTPQNSDYKWFPIIRGGDFRKWYGNMENVINLYQEGKDIRNSGNNYRLRTPDFYNKKGITWNRISSRDVSFRIKTEQVNFGENSPCMFVNENDYLSYIGFLNSKVAKAMLEFINSTMTFQVIDIQSIPYKPINSPELNSLVLKCIELSKEEWDSYENSWDFKKHPFICNERLIENAFTKWERRCINRFNLVKKNEERINEILICHYGLEDILDPTVSDDDITIRLSDKTRDIKNYISYSVGCMFGRYSLDTEGLAYAGGNWDNSIYKTFNPDTDNIIPICDDEYFEDDIVGRFIEFIRVAHGEETLEENLQFIADALGGKGTSREVIRNYFLNDFFKDHCASYNVTSVGKRPIYWQFDSGNAYGFKALIYIHRYTPDLIARMRTSYVHEQQSRYDNQLSMIQNKIDTAVSTSERVKAEKELKKIKEQADELRSYEEKIHHWADKMEPMDLDDGVKANYAKFQELLTKIK